jgi:hypothetical protein
MQRAGLGLSIVGISLSLVALGVPDIPEWIRPVVFWAGIAGIILGGVVAGWATRLLYSLRQWASALIGLRGSNYISVEEALRQIALCIKTDTAAMEVEIVRESRAAYGLEEMAFDGRITIHGRKDKGEKIAPISASFWKDHGFDLVYSFLPGSPGARTERRTAAASHDQFDDLRLSTADFRRAIQAARRNKRFGADQGDDYF